MTNEQDYRIGILNSLLTSTHRKIDDNQKFHSEVCAIDPIFYTHLAAWYNNNGDLSDHKLQFIANLCVSDFEGHRDCGLAMLRELPPFHLTRIIDIIRYGEIKPAKGTKPKRNIPRSTRTEIISYLKEREQDHEWLDNAIITARKHFKQLYATLHIKPSSRAQAILFEDNPPIDSKCYAIKIIARESDPTKQAELLNKYKMPYRIASTVIKSITPSILAVLIDLMSPQELINSMSSLQKHGAFNNDDIKALVEKKLKVAKTSKKVGALKGMEAVKAAGLTEDLNEKLKDIVDSQIKNKGRIKRSTAIFVDKSQSMTQAIELAKQVATLVSATMDADLYCYVFDVMARKIIPLGKEYKHWDAAFMGTNASGGTMPGAAVQQLLRNNEKVEQIIMITDEGENHISYMPALKQYEIQTGIKPYTYIIRCGSRQYGVSDRITKSLQTANYDVDAYDFSSNSDYNSLPNIVQFLTRPSRLELLMDIMDYKLPSRKSLQKI